MAFPKGKTSPRKGVKLSEETKAKISASMKTHTPWNKGIPHSEETRKKISQHHIENGVLSPSQKGYTHTEATKQKISKSQMGNTFSKGIKWSEESRRKITKVKSHQELEWGKFRECREYREWRTAIFERDNWTCQDCGEKGKRLHVDHIKKWSEYPELRFELSNGRTLCESCHKLTPNYGNRHQRKYELQYA